MGTEEEDFESALGAGSEIPHLGLERSTEPF